MPVNFLVTSFTVLNLNYSAIAVVVVVAAYISRFLAENATQNSKSVFFNLLILMLQLLQIVNIVKESECSKGFCFSIICNNWLNLLQIVTNLLQVVTSNCYILLQSNNQYSKGFRRFVTM